MTTKKMKKHLTLVTKEAATRAYAAGTRVAKEMIEAADAALVAQGKAARNRQRRRALKAALKVVRTTTIVAGTAAATVLATRLARHRKLS